MDTEELCRQLEAAKNALERALDAARRDQIAEDAAPYIVAECSYCGKPIFSTDKISRGCHRHCYNWLNTHYVRNGKKTWDQLEAEGKIAPKAKPGRPSSDPARDGKQ